MVERALTIAGFELVTAGALGQPGDYEINRVAPPSITEAARELGTADVDGLFISCTGLRVAALIDDIEQDIGKPVVTSNQAQAWHALRLAGIDEPALGRGRLFELVS